MFQAFYLHVSVLEFVLNSSSSSLQGVAHVTVRMADVQYVPSAVLHLVPELMLLTLERAELVHI